eukprot:COSAG06_NODE_2822_length_6230_cov_332.215299_4_plen_69_part_00
MKHALKGTALHAPLRMAIAASSLFRPMTMRSPDGTLHSVSAVHLRPEVGLAGSVQTIPGQVPTLRRAD